MISPFENISHTAEGAEINYKKMKDPREFPVRPVDDWIIVDKITVKSNQQKLAEKSKIDLIEGKAPMNIMDLEREKATDLAKYENAEDKLLEMWDEHPMQGIVKAIGPGRALEEGVVIPVSVKVGDHIFIRGRTGEPIVINKKVYWMHKAHEVFAVLKKT